MHDHTNLFEMCVIDCTARNFFVGIADNRSFKVAPTNGEEVLEAMLDRSAALQAVEKLEVTMLHVQADWIKFHILHSCVPILSDKYGCMRDIST